MSAAGLIADIGGTNVRFALADAKGIHHEEVLKVGDYPGLVEAAQSYMRQAGRPEVRDAFFAIAGPVTGDRFAMTNHHWSFSVNETRERLGLERFRLVNDFEAIAMAAPHLKEGSDYRVAKAGEAAPEKPIGIIGPGTGLGVASLVWDGRQYRTVPGEGGHVTMPAKTQREFDVFRRILADNKNYSHVSVERVCSGKGLANIYNALRGLDGSGDLPELDPEEISKRALEKSCAVCEEALGMMMGFLGSAAGNHALTIGAFGGIYIAGGIVPKLGNYFDRSRFNEEFLAKGRFSDYLAPVPVYVITNEFPAFVGLRAELMRTP